MRVRLWWIGALVLLTTNIVSATFLTTALGTGFIGGFLMGKITLGVFLAAMNSLGQRPTTIPASAQSQSKLATKDQSSFMDIPDGIETEVRDRFLRQIGKMDPLNCLPKVFCEVSADPSSASSIFGQNYLTLLPQQSPFNDQKTNSKKHQDDLEDDVGDEYSNSQSNEDDQELDDLGEYKKKQKYALKNEGYNQMLNDYDDPLEYYFMLKEKNIPIHPELLSLIKNRDYSSRKGLNNKKIPKNGKQTIKKRIGEMDFTSRKSGVTTTTESSIDDAFEDDPFFKEFSKSLQQPGRGSGAGGVVNVGLLRRNRRSVFGSSDDDATMAKYKMAAEIAEQKDPKKCQRVFNTCPFSSEEVMDMIGKMNSEEDGKKIPSFSKKNKNKNNKDDTNLKNLRNTLLAIEKLNDATIQAESLGKSVNYTQVIQDATKSSSVSDSSAKILEEFQQLENRFVPDEALERTGEMGVQIMTKKPNKKTKKQKQSVRTRRHDDASRIRWIPVRLSSSEKNRKARISLLQRPGRLVLSADRDDEFIYQKRRTTLRENSEEDLTEGNVASEESSLPTFYLAEPTKILTNKENDAEGRRVRLDELEDDEINSPESEEPVVKASPLTFSPSFIESLGHPSVRKPKPIHKVVKVKQQQQPVRSSALNKTPSSGVPSTTPKPIKKITTAPKLRQKFSGESEDDEADAINSEREIDVLVSKYKPKGKGKLQ